MSKFIDEMKRPKTKTRKANALHTEPKDSRRTVDMVVRVLKSRDFVGMDGWHGGCDTMRCNLMKMK